MLFTIMVVNSNVTSMAQVSIMYTAVTARGRHRGF